MARLARLAFVVLAILPRHARASEGDYKNWVLPKELPPVTEAQRALKDVPFAPGAPAVVLFEGEQQDWAGLTLMRDTFMRRVKILNSAGVERHSDFDMTIYGGGRIQKIEARTILPDGTIVDAADKVRREKSDDGNRSDDDDMETVTITFPRVEVGAILDVLVHAHHDGYFIDPWTVQEHVPVLESRFVLIPPNGLPFRTAVVNLPPEKADPVSFRYGETHAHVWSFKDVPPIPDLPNMPPDGEIAQAMMVIYGKAEATTAAQWRLFARGQADEWEEWLRMPHGKASALAKEAAGAATGQRDKAEAIRKALRDRVTTSRSSIHRSHENADSVLEAGQGTSADVAGLTLAMLRAVDVPAKLALTRRRDSGGIPTQVPIEGLYDDYLVVLAEGEGAAAQKVFYSPGSTLPVGQLPWENTGVLAVVLDKETSEPVGLPSLPAERNRVSRQVQAAIDPAGNLSAQAVVTCSGYAADDWREDLRGQAPDAQKALVQDDVRGGVPGAIVDALQIDGLDSPDADLVLTFAFTAEGYATKAGPRLLVSPFLLSGVDATDWSEEKRSVDVDLGNPFLSEESVMLQLPEGTASARHPAPSTMNAGDTGAYETSFEGKGRAILCKRSLRLNAYRFVAANWAPLRKWFLDMATNDDQPIVIELKPEGA